MPGTAVGHVAGRPGGRGDGRPMARAGNAPVPVGLGIPVRSAVAGASGFVGRALVARLAADGHEVVALSRRGTAVAGAEARAVDVGDAAAVEAALAGVDVAYYLVHSLEVGDFRARDRRLAGAFGAAAAAAGVRRIVYLGGLGEDPSSEHLASRQEVGVALGAAGVPVVELRAAVVLGAGSISFEMLRYLTERLPFMVCPRWVRTAIQPIALADVIEHLVRSVDVASGVYEVGGAEVTTYRDMIAAYAMARGLPKRLIVDVPYLTPRLSSYWVDFVTPVDRNVSHALIESLVTEVVVRDGARTRDAFGIVPMGVVDAIVHALDDQADALDRDLLSRESGLLDGVYTERVVAACGAVDPAAVDADLDRIGGDLGWYGLVTLWRVRLLLGRLIGEQWALSRPERCEATAEVDWWTVVEREPGRLVLRGRGWRPGEAWFGYEVDDGRVLQVGALRTKGVLGFLYWKALVPVHRRVFVSLARHRVARSRPPGAARSRQPVKAGSTSTGSGAGAGSGVARVTSTGT